MHVSGALTHKEAMPNERAREADSIAAWLSRNFLRQSFQRELYRNSLIFPMRNLKNPRILVNQHKSEVAKLFREADAVRLHEAVLSSKLLNLFSEARQYPTTSLKYHILLSCALYYNYSHNYKMNELYLCENRPVQSPFQIIYQDPSRTWAILPHQRKDEISRVYAHFFRSWERRRVPVFGGDYRVLSGILSSIGSWSTALATIEDFQELSSLC
ncbi:MAG: hypothetical protein ACTSRC_01270 [Candidatus Helarchaeota archaeon]